MCTIHSYGFEYEFGYKLQNYVKIMGQKIKPCVNNLMDILWENQKIKRIVHYFIVLIFKTNHAKY